MLHVGYERRKEKDMVTKLISYNATMGWIVLIFTSIIFHIARPDRWGDRHWKLGNNTEWDPQYSQYLLIFCGLGFTLSLIGLFVNILRNRRKKDFLHINLIVLAITTLVGIVLYTVNF